jgi:hypothetical protein
VARLFSVADIRLNSTIYNTVRERGYLGAQPYKIAIYFYSLDLIVPIPECAQYVKALVSA